MLIAKRINLGQNIVMAHQSAFGTPQTQTPAVNISGPETATVGEVVTYTLTFTPSTGSLNLGEQGLAYVLPPAFRDNGQILNTNPPATFENGVLRWPITPLGTGSLGLGKVSSTPQTYTIMIKHGNDCLLYSGGNLANHIAYLYSLSNPLTSTQSSQETWVGTQPCYQTFLPLFETGGTPSLTATRIISYTYDEVYRLTEANYSTGEVYTYTYDSVGNRQLQGISGTVTTYNYDAINRMISSTVSGQSAECPSSG